jgi:GNAT superfamily N-acetyltransferase
MAAHENLSEYQFRYRPVKSEELHEVQAIHKPTGEPIGRMTWLNYGPLDEIDVQHEHQRRGVATGMWNHAIRLADSSYYKGVNKRIPMPEHSIFRTPAGDAWAKSTDDNVPDNVFDQYDSAIEAYRNR